MSVTFCNSKCFKKLHFYRKFRELYKNVCGWRCRYPLSCVDTFTSLYYKHGNSIPSFHTCNGRVLCFLYKLYPIFLHAIHSLIFSFSFSHIAPFLSFAFIFISWCCQASLEFQGSSCPASGFQTSDTICTDHPSWASSKSISESFLQVISDFLLQLVQWLVILKNSNEPYIQQQSSYLKVWVFNCAV